MLGNILEYLYKKGGKGRNIHKDITGYLHRKKRETNIDREKYIQKREREGKERFKREYKYVGISLQKGEKRQKYP